MEIVSNTPSNHHSPLEQPSNPFLANSEKQKEPVSLTKSTTWTQRELYLIASFFYYHSSKLGSDSARKKWKVFKIMSNLIQTRNVNQCRSYTKKLFKTFKTVSNIISFFKTSLPRYKQSLEQHKTINSTIYENVSQFEQDSASCKQNNQKQMNEEERVKSEIYQQIYQNKVEICEVDQNQKTNVVLPQLKKSIWFNHNHWLCNYQDFLFWTVHPHYFSFITGCNQNLQ